MNRATLIELLNQHQLKITPQRIAVYEALIELDHPDAEVLPPNTPKVPYNPDAGSLPVQRHGKQGAIR